MPRSRTRTTSKSTTTRRRTRSRYNKWYPRHRLARSNRTSFSGPFKMVRSADILTISNALSPTVNYYGQDFRLDQILSYAEFVALFDNYRIDKVKLIITPIKNQQNDGFTDTPRLHYCIDYDDSNAPTSIVEMQEYSSYKVYEGNKPLVLFLQPKISLQTYRTGLAEAYCRPDAFLQSHLQLDCANPDIRHYGIKFAIEPSSSGANYFQYKVTAKFYLSFFGLR